MRHLLIIGIAILLVGCSGWRSELRDGNYAGACRMTQDIDKPREQRAARATVSRAYTEVADVSANLGTLRLEAERAGVFDDARFRIVRIRANPAIELRALRIDRTIWLPVVEEDVSAAIARAVGLDVVKDSAPVAKAIGEAADRYVRDVSKGALDTRLRERKYGVIPVCREQKGCKARREAFKWLNARFAKARECQSDDCERLYILKRTWDATGPATARVLVHWELEGCLVSHHSDIAPFEPVGPSELAGEWVPADPPLVECTHDRFQTDECQARIEPDAQ